MIVTQANESNKVTNVNNFDKLETSPPRILRKMPENIERMVQDKSESNFDSKGERNKNKKAMSKANVKLNKMMQNTISLKTLFSR